MADRHLTRKLKVTCPKCNGHRSVYGKNAMGNPATLPCERCINSSGEVWEDSLTEIEKNPLIPMRYIRDDL